jgi:predicted aldo/keto reductase-like oxidoreductase
LAEWAFHFVRQVPGVTVTLSGMSDPMQIRENAKIFSDPNPLSEEEKAVLLEVANQMTSPTTLPCTSCRYCVSHCPKELDIPWIIELYNEQKYSGFGFRTKMALSAMAEEKKPTACIGCASCESVCPQTIKISQMMADFSQTISK